MLWRAGVNVAINAALIHIPSRVLEPPLGVFLVLVAQGRDGHGFPLSAFIGARIQTPMGIGWFLARFVAGLVRRAPSRKFRSYCDASLRICATC